MRENRTAQWIDSDINLLIKKEVVAKVKKGNRKVHKARLTGRAGKPAKNTEI